MTEEEKVRMEEILLHRMEEDDRLCPIAEAVVGEFVTVVLPRKFLLFIPMKVAFNATIIERDLSRPHDGVRIELLNDRVKTLRLPLDYPCYTTPGVEN